MAINTTASGNFQKLVGEYDHPLLQYWEMKFEDNIKNSMIPVLFDKQQSSNPSEGISELVGAVDYKPWEGQFTYAQLKEGNTKLITPVVWQRGLSFDRFTLSNAKLTDLKAQYGRFAIAAARLREECAAGIFTYADQTSFTAGGYSLDWTKTANGVALASNAQTSANYSTNQDNLEALELTEENLETVCQKMFDTKDENGNAANLQPTTLIVPTALRKKALEIVGADGKSDTADNNPNIYNGSMRVIVWKEFRKQTAKTGQPWVVVDEEQLKSVLLFINRLENGEDFEVNSYTDMETLTYKINSILWFGCGIFDWRTTQFSIPA